MTQRQIVEGIVTAHMQRIDRMTLKRRPAVVVRLLDGCHGSHCVCAVPPGMTPPNGSRVRVVVPRDSAQEVWFLAPRMAA